MNRTENKGKTEPLPAKSAERLSNFDETALHDPLVARLFPILHNDQLAASPLYDDFSALFNAYIRQTRRMKRIVRISDHYQSQLQELKARIKGVVEMEERSRLYRDLHDGAGQSLQAVRLHLKMLADGKGGYDDPRLLAAQLAQEVADVAAELHDIAHQLRPSYLLEISLDKAVVKRCDMLRRRGIPVEVTCDGDFGSLSHAVSDNFYRIAQEALANAARHAGAGLISISLTRDNNRLELVIADNGCGMEYVPGEGDGLGLRIMQERAGLIGARLEITTSASGTTISVTVESA